MTRLDDNHSRYTVDPGQFESVAYQASETSCTGSLVRSAPPDAGGILLFPEWWGVDEYALWRASRLAELGYTVFVADMYGEGIVTEDPERAASLAADTRTGPEARLRARSALDTMAEATGIQTNCIVAIGYCFGGTVALELARSGADLAGVVACHASLTTPLPAQPGGVSCPVLVLHGGADPLVPDDDVAQLASEMDRAGADWQLVVYGGAQHSFTRPDADRFQIEGVSYDQRADTRSWVTIEAFISEAIRPQSRRPTD